MGQFKGISGLGAYKTARGTTVTVTGNDDNGGNLMWHCSDGFWRNDLGQPFPESAPSDHRNFVEGPIADEPELAGLTGFAGVQGDRLIIFKIAEHAFELGWESVIDLKTIRKDQLVRPERKRETRKVTLVMYRNGAVLQWGQTSDQIRGVMDLEVVAVVEREIEFTVGEGLEVTP